MHSRCIALSVNCLEGDNRFPHHAGKKEPAVHNQTSRIPLSYGRSLSAEAGDSSPMGLHEGTGEFAAYPRLPLHELPAGFRLSFTLVHIVS